MANNDYIVSSDSHRWHRVVILAETEAIGSVVRQIPTVETAS